jgi:DNA-binding NarL/FixJ family response regulator
MKPRTVLRDERSGRRYQISGTVSGETGTRVARGEVVFGLGIVKRLIRYFSSLAEVRAPRAVFPEITDREREILDLTAAGKNNQESPALFPSLKTVRNYVSNIFAKLPVGDRTQPSSLPGKQRWAGTASGSSR